MAKLTEELISAWEDMAGPVILSTVDGDSNPNIIYATCVGRFGDDALVVADNYFDKTRQNLLSGSKKGAILFMTAANKAYQVKGTLEYHKDGEIFDNMKTWNPEKHPGHAAAVLRVEEAYSGAQKVL